jgi:hypothetical protein
LEEVEQDVVPDKDLQYATKSSPSFILARVWSVVLDTSAGFISEDV